jgi:glycosyltransferase involved in cell wall biosynthesis
MNAPITPLNLAGKKIVILVGAFNRGGAERQAYLLVRQFRERYLLDAEVWALCWDAEYRKTFEAAGVPTRVLEWRPPIFPCVCCGVNSPRWIRAIRWLARVWRVSRQLRAGKIDILLPFTAYPNIVAGLAYRLAGIELCIWGERHAGGERLYSAERISVRQYRRFVANSTAGVEFLANVMRVPRERISMVPNGVEEPPAGQGADWREKLGLAPGQLLVVKVANLSRFKDHATLLRAWKRVQEAWPTVERPVLALAGAYDDRFVECQAIARELDVLSTVRFLGSIGDVPGLLRACDLTTFSSLNEGMPNGVLECMAAGKAMVASDLPGIRDALGPHPGGILVPPGDVEAMAHGLLILLHDKQKRDALGNANLARIRAEFSVERMAERHLKIIQDSVPKARAGAPAYVCAERRA